MKIINYTKYECDICKRKHDSKDDCLECESRCLEKSFCKHIDKNKKLTIGYDDTYEMRSSSMHCKQCNKKGSRSDFESRLV